jgi:hypothetical protein
MENYILSAKESAELITEGFPIKKIHINVDDLLAEMPSVKIEYVNGYWTVWYYHEGWPSEKLIMALVEVWRCRYRIPIY